MRAVQTLLALIVVAAVGLSPTPASAGTDAIQPGDVLWLPDGQCTTNFVFDAPGKVYIGTAAHCGDAGDKVGTAGFGDFGTIVYDNDAYDIDFALIEVDSAYHGSVKAEVLGHPGVPTGHTLYQETFIGDTLGFSGYGVGYSLTKLTREERVGVLLLDNAKYYCSESPVIFGDSGGPVFHTKTGKALGIVSGSGFGCASWLKGPTLQGAIAAAKSDGFDITLRSA